MISRWLAVVALGGAVVAVSACSSDDEPADKGKEADCEAIIDACHTKDDGAQGELTTCHETAHETSEGTDYTFCKENKARCVALCDAAPVVETGGSGGAGGSGTGGHSHGGAGGEAAGGAGGDSHGGAGGAAGAAGSGGHSHGGAGGAAAGAGGA